MAYINPFNVEDKEDSADKLAYASGKPTKFFLFHNEFNAIKSAFSTFTGWINSLVSSKEDKVSGVIAYGIDNYTATIPNVEELLEGHKMLFLFENPNTGASTLNPNELGVIEIVKEGNVQLVANDLLGVHWLMYDGEKLQVVGHVPEQFPFSLDEIESIKNANAPSGANPVATMEDLEGLGGGGGGETFSILWSPDGVYGEQNMNFNTVDQFKFSPAHSFQNAFTSVNSSTTAVDPVAPGFVIPYDCVLFKAIIRFGYSDSSPGRRDVQVFAQVGDSSSAPTFMNENLNKVILINTRINEGVTGFFSQDTTVNDIPIIDVNHVIPANSVFKHMVAGKYNLGTLRFQLQYFFRKV